MGILCLVPRRQTANVLRKQSTYCPLKQRQNSSGPLRPRLERIQRRLPPRLQRLTATLVGAPTSHIISFLILHEMTALLPLIGLTAFFHYTHWSPEFILQTQWVEKGVSRFRAYFLRKGWISQEEAASLDVGNEDVIKVTQETQGRLFSILVVELGIAYALIKIALPARIALSVALTPWFARSVCSPFSATFRRMWTGQK